METCHLAELPPAYSQSTCASSKTQGNNGGFLYDDFAREIPVVPVAQHWQARSVTAAQFKSPVYIATCLALVIFLVQLGTSLTDVPAIQLLESIICQQASLDSTMVMMLENQCWSIDVQAELNVISMGALVLGYLPGILVAVPYGMLSDRFGRKAVLALSIFGMVVSQLIWAVIAWNWRRWGPRYTWTSFAALFIGGGESVAQGMVFAMIADVTPKNKRATCFQIEMCAIILGQVLAPFISASMMTYSLWLPLLAAPGIVAVGGLLIPMIPDTLGMKRYHEMQNGSSQSPHPEELFRRLPRQPSNFDPWTTPWSRVRDTVQALLRLVRIREVKLLLSCAALIVPVVTVSMNIFLRYMPVRFGWALAETGMLLGAGAGLSAFVIVGLLPFSPHLFSKIRQERHDLIAARVSMALLVAGMASIGAATDVPVAVAGLAIMTLGSSAPALCRASLVRFAADRDLTIGQIFGVLAVYEVVGYVFCGVGLGALYQVCLHWAHLETGPTEDAAWMALVFYAATAILFGCGMSLGLVDAKKFLLSEDSDSDSEDDEVEVASVPRGFASIESEHHLYETRIFADGRIVRKGPSLESVCLVA